MTRLRILEEWNKFSKACGIEKYSIIQQVEMKRAFYGGVWAMLNLNLEIAEYSEDEGVKILQELTKESQQLSRDVVNGRAW